MGDATKSLKRWIWVDTMLYWDTVLQHMNMASFGRTKDLTYATMSVYTFRFYFAFAFFFFAEFPK